MEAVRLPLSSSKYSIDKSLSIYNIQQESYDALTKKDGSGIFKILKSFFPITSPDGLVSMDLVDCSIEEPKFSIQFCRTRLLSYVYSLYGTFSIIRFTVDKDTGAKEVLYIKKQTVFLFNLPVMIRSGSFLINGIEKVVVPQMHRAPGLFIFDNIGTNAVNYSARIVPYNGAWLEFEIDSKNNINVRINNRRKINLIYFLFAIDCSVQEVIDLFFNKVQVKVSSSYPEGMLLVEPSTIEAFENKSLPFSISDENGKQIYQSGTKITKNILKKLLSTSCFVALNNAGTLYLSEAIDAGTKVFGAGTFLDQDVLANVVASHKECKVDLFFSNYLLSPQIVSYLFTLDTNEVRTLGLSELYRILRPGNPFSYDDALGLLNYLFFDPKYYNLLEVGRHRLNEFLELDTPLDHTVLTKQDILASCRALLKAKAESRTFKDLDSLEHRRVRAVGELVEGVISSAMLKLAKYISDKFVSTADAELLLPQNIIISNIINSALRDFFLLSELSHFMDSTNPLSETSHKRRLTSLGPGGLDRSLAGIEARDVDPSHYGRICPVETSEGQNIGLIANLAFFSTVNRYGFLCSPYRKVEGRRVLNDVAYLDFRQERNNVIASFTKGLLDNDKIAKDFVMARKGGEVVMVPAEEVNYIDFSPVQLISVSASLIPFIEHDDTSRALMGANMQRQALPLMSPTPPIAGTGVESVFMKNSNSVVRATRAGKVTMLFSDKIFVSGVDKATGEKYVDVYHLKKFDRTNQDTINSQSPIVSLGDRVEKDQILSDGQSSDGKEIALGKNVLVGFMTWKGYNFEDSIILSQKLVASEEFTSIHIEEYSIEVKDTRLGSEEVTREIPNIPEGAVQSLDESGVVKEGTFVKAGDILVGKVTPKTQDLLTPEERLLKAIFGERGSEVSDSSLTVPPGTSGVVIGVRIISRRGIEKIKRAVQEEEKSISSLVMERDAKLAKIAELYNEVVSDLLVNQTLLVSSSSKKQLNTNITADFLSEMSLDKKFELKLTDKSVQVALDKSKEEYYALVEKTKDDYDDLVNNLYVGDELPQGVLMSIKVYLAVKRVIQPGDKMAGRHGNKGVVSKIVPIEDMPFLKDGTPLDILLSPLGIPQRMNVGQVFETHLGLVGKELGKRIDQMLRQKQVEYEIKEMIKDIVNHPTASDFLDSLSFDDLKNTLKLWARDGVRFACPSFDSIKSEEISSMLNRLGYNKTGQMDVYDGFTGDKFDRQITVGYIYMLKLHHIVEEKIHARSVGSYSLITQQPLGGRSNFGGQRFGEMECWALQAYGAAYTLQEILTVKSDDVVGRSKMYESIVRGDSNFTYNIPESFNVLVRQLRSLCLNIEVAESNEILVS